MHESTPLQGRRTLLFALGAALLAAVARVRAHDGKADAPKHAAPKKEQKPWGIAGDAKAVRRKVDIRMLDTMRFEPDRIEVRLGETLRLVHHNLGRVMHEFVIGTRKDLDEHAALMVRFPGMEHDEPYMAHVAPGRTGQIIWRFNRAGEFPFACLIAGHYQAGMVGTIVVKA